MTQDSQGLLPCPFCGSVRSWQPNNTDWFQRQCEDCGASTARCVHEYQAIAAWNRRANVQANESAAVRPRIVCLCGSSRFFKEYQQAEYDETMAGRIYLSIGFYPHTPIHGEGVGHDSKEKIALDELHKRKIDLADEIFVLNVGGYIGDSTKSEVRYAIEKGKSIRWLESESAAQQVSQDKVGVRTSPVENPPQPAAPAPTAGEPEEPRWIREWRHSAPKHVADYIDALQSHTRTLAALVEELTKSQAELTKKIATVCT